MEGESINEVENVSTSNTFITYYLLVWRKRAENDMETRTMIKLIQD